MINLSYTTDEYNKEILINKDTNEQVMMKWDTLYGNLYKSIRAQR